MGWRRRLLYWPWKPPEPYRMPQDEPNADPAPDSLLDVIARGVAAERLLNDPVLKAALDEIQTTAVEMWLASKPSEADRREELFRQVKAIELLRGKLRSYRGAALVRQAEYAA